MRPGTTPHVVSQLLPFRSGFDNGVSDALTAGVSKDGLIAWTVRESVLEVVDTNTAQCLALWKFGEVIRDNHTYITCVKEYHYGNTLKLLVGVCNASESGMLCVLDVGFSRVIKATELPHKISAIDPVTSVGGDKAPMWALNTQLRQFNGIVAVGTNCGIVYLVDMCLDDQNDASDEINPNKLLFITPRSRDTTQRRKEAISRNQQLCMVLDEEAQGTSFKYRRCDGEIIRTFDADDVHVSCLKYIPQTGSLGVGFSFGCYQLWKLHVPVLEYSSRYENCVVPITHMTYQEPENDPKNFSYLWAVRSTEDQEDDSLASISMYQLAYNKKTWYSSYGAFYEDLTSVSLRFDLELVASPLNHSVKGSTTSRIVSCYTLEDPCYTPPSRLAEDESFEEAIHGPDLSLCVFVWECNDSVSPHRSCHMGVFDMNRWYHAQMPTTVRSTTGAMDTCPYFSFLSLDEVVDKAFPDNLLAVHVLVDRLRRFVNTSPMPPEQHFYPSALAFDTLVVLDSGMVKAHYLGTQRQVLASMQKMGPSVLLNPRELYNLCVFVGLLPRPLDVASHNPTTNLMRESLLSMALDHNMRPFIMKCVLDWAPGEYVHMGCTLKMLLDWVWDKVAQIKEVIDTTCVCLFDWSGLSLDQRGLKNIHQSNQRLSIIISIFKILIDQSSSMTEQGFVDLHNKLSVVTFLQQHLQILMLFVSVGLLPENDETADLQEHQYSYPAGDLIQAYKLRRQELHKLSSDIGSTDLLMIDGLIEEMGPSVKNLWSREGGNGLYPPPSLHALLSIYLLEDIDLLAKHSLVLYVLLDLVSLSTSTKHELFAEKVQKFTKAFSIPFTIIKQVQGFWLLDHKDFEESVTVLLDPLITTDMGVWQHSRIIKSFLYQDKSKMAVRYLNTRQPSLNTLQEVKLKLMVLLANGLTAQALEYLRSCRDQSNIQEMLHHLFMGCHQSKTINQLLQLPLTEAEEECLAKFLSESCDPQLLELLVLHYLQKARYVEAIQLNEKLKQTVMTDTSSKARERAAIRNALVDGFKCVLPEVQKKLIFENINLPKRMASRRKEVRRPQPLSTIVTKRSHNNIRSKSSLYTEVVDKVQEISMVVDPEAPGDTKQEASTTAAVNTLLGTPRTPAIKSFIQSQPVLYPSVKKIDMSSSPQQTPWKPPNLTNISALTSSKYGSPFPSIRKAKFLGADTLSLLQTPVINRKTPRKSFPSSSRVATPQSILKVRSCVKSIISPSSHPGTADNSIQGNEEVGQVSTSQRALPKRLGFNESSLPSTPRSVSFAKDSSAVNSPKQLRFAEADSSNSCTPKQLRFTNIKPSRTSPKSPPSPGSPRSIKDRSPTPESISRSPRNVSKLDKVTRSPQSIDKKSVAMETKEESGHESEVTQQVDDDIIFHFNKSRTDSTETPEDMDTSMDTPSPNSAETKLPGVGSLQQEVNNSKTTAREDITSSSDVLNSAPVKKHSPKAGKTVLNETPTVHSSKILQQFRSSPILGSPKKLLGNQQKTPRSPTVKLSSGRYTPKFIESKDDEKVEAESVTKELVSTTTNINTSIEIDLTMDEDMAVKQESGHLGNDLRDNVEEIVDVKPIFYFAPPVSANWAEADRKDFSKLRAKPHFTFSPPVHLPSSDRIKYEDKNQSSVVGSSSFIEDSSKSVIQDGESKTGEISAVKERRGKRTRKISLSPEVKDIIQKSPVSPRRSLRIYNSFVGSNTVEVVTPVGLPRQKTQMVYNSLGGSEKEVKVELPKMRKASLKSPKFKFSLKSPQSTQKLQRRVSSSDKVSKSPKSASQKDKKSLRGSQNQTKPESLNSSSNVSSDGISSPKKRRGSMDTLLIDSQERSSPSKGMSPGRSRKISVQYGDDETNVPVDKSPSRRSKKSPGRPKKQASKEEVEKTVAKSPVKTRKSGTRRRGESPSPSKRKIQKEGESGHFIITRSRSRSLSPQKDSATGESPSRDTVVQKENSSSFPDKQDKSSIESPQKTSPVGRRGRPRRSTPRKVSLPSKMSSIAPPQQADIPEADDMPLELPKSPGRTRAATRSRSGKQELLQYDSGNNISLSNDKLDDVSVVKTKSPGRKKSANRSVAEKQENIENKSETNAHQLVEDVSVVGTKSPGRKKKTTKSKPVTDEKEEIKVQTTEEVQSMLMTSLPPSPPTSDKNSPVQQVSTPHRRTRGTTPVMTPTRRSSRLLKEEVKKTEEEEMIVTETKSDRSEEITGTLPSVQENQVPSPTSFEFSEPMQLDEAEIDSKPLSPEQFVEVTSFVFSPPLTRGLSKRTSIEPDGKTSISKRLSIEQSSTNSLVKTQRLLNQDKNSVSQSLEALPSSKLYDLDIAPRPPIHSDKTIEPVSRSRRGRRPRSHTPESEGQTISVPDRAESEPPSQPTKEKVKRRTRKKESEDAIVLISPIKEEEDEETGVRETRQRKKGVSQTATRSKTKGRGKRVAKLW